MSNPISGEVLADIGTRLALIEKSLWSADAEMWLIKLQRGTRFTSENLIEAIGLPGEGTTNSNNAVGAKIREWSNDQAISRIGFQRATRLTSHARAIALWEKL